MWIQIYASVSPDGGNQLYCVNKSKGGHWALEKPEEGVRTWEDVVTYVQEQLSIVFKRDGEGLRIEFPGFNEISVSPHRAARLYRSISKERQMELLKVVDALAASLKT